MKKEQYLPSYDLYPGHVKLMDFYQWLQENVAKVPEEYQADAEIYFATSNEGDPTEAMVWYERPMTSEEIGELERLRREALEADQEYAARCEALKKAKENPISP